MSYVLFNLFLALYEKIAQGTHQVITSFASAATGAN